MSSSGFPLAHCRMIRHTWFMTASLILHRTTVWDHERGSKVQSFERAEDAVDLMMELAY